MKTNFSLKFAPLSLATLLEIFVIAAFPQTLTAQSSAPLLSQNLAGNKEIFERKINFKPPKVGAPDNRKGGASRRGTMMCSQNQKTLKALLPGSTLGLTVEKYPTFFVYIPSVSRQLAEFELREKNNSTVVYKTRFTLPASSGIVSFSLPTNKTLQPLEIGKNYKWSFSIICDSQDRSEDIFVEGWVQRIEPSSTLVSQLEKATSRDRPSLYAEAGIWYETLTTLAQLRYSNPQDLTLVADWKELLESVGLNSIAEEPLVQTSINYKAKSAI
ncbi:MULTISPECIES: DUF928 domain-containing protein [unclassified Nostoc]|uniref:DUF928 domain-containing protein n=1 Tax=unclassified Nostoc TaxID=2593658 RepID=UPI002AD41C23|nr:DUF928 domain-containing protein [Nostoc sp. DedQUE03]MDZ7973658.1 DUF928 domain-containing protein [Nostoc sp. DedQUE03]MDZ8049831.1 DUF928 domain-containing protein [Nostoc sp. DedQUE02]